jgi:hypothetical protein
MSVCKDVLSHFQLRGVIVQQVKVVKNAKAQVNFDANNHVDRI